MRDSAEIREELKKVKKAARKAPRLSDEHFELLEKWEQLVDELELVEFDELHEE